jgi:hypothetical protein
MGSNFVASCPVTTDFVKEFGKKKKKDDSSRTLGATLVIYQLAERRCNGRRVRLTPGGRSSIPSFSKNPFKLQDNCLEKMNIHKHELRVSYRTFWELSLYNYWYVSLTLTPGWNGTPSRPVDSRLIRTTRTDSDMRVYTLLPPDDGLLASPKHVKV